MTAINTVLGTIDSSALGYTLMHEHLLAASAGIARNYPELLGEGYMERIVDELTRAKEGGIDTIVDASTFDMGRDVSVLAEASRRTGVNIIACTGWFHSNSNYVGEELTNLFARLFIREITEGIAGTGIKAGILKSAADFGGVTASGETMLRAVARAHLETGIPIMLHSYAPEQVGRQQLAILKDEGVDLRRVKVDHSLDTTDTDYLTWLLEQGCYLGMERCPGFIVSAQAHAKTMKALIDAGWAHRLLPSHDYLIVKSVPEIPAKLRDFIENGNPYGLLYIKKVLFPLIREMGVSDEVLNNLCITGPQHFFENV